MSYIKTSENINRYILTVFISIAIMINIIIIILVFTLENYITIKYKVTLNFIAISISIYIYIWVFLISTSKFNNYMYCINNGKIEVIEGALIISRKIMPVEKIYKVEVIKGVIGRIFKVGSIKFISSGADIKIKYIDYENIDEFLKQIRKIKYE